MKGDVDNQAADRLAVAFKAGERPAFRQLMLLTARDLRIYVASFTDSRQLVEEVLQDAYVAVFEHIQGYEPRGAFMAWLCRIARNRLLDHWRQSRRHGALNADDVEIAIADSGLQDLEDANSRAAASSRLRACLDQLAPRARKLVQGRHLEERSLDEL